MKVSKLKKKVKVLSIWAALAFFYLPLTGLAQQLIWAKLYKLKEDDEILCITKDEWGDMYVGGSSYNGAFFPGGVQRAMIYKLGVTGDTIFSLWTQIYGDVSTISVDYDGNVKIAVQKLFTFASPTDELHLLTMTPDGFIFKRDTIKKIRRGMHSMIGKDSSWIICGYARNPINGMIDDVYIQRIRKDGTIEPEVILNDNFSGRASRVEQLPNGKYLVSGSAGRWLFSYTLNEDLSNPQPMQIWHTSPTVSYNGVVGQAKNKSFVIGTYSSTSIVGLYDSLRRKIWMKKDTGNLISPQAMTDGSILSGYSQRPKIPWHLFTRRAADSSTIWFLNLKDSLVARGMNGSVNLNTFTFFEDQSAVVAGTHNGNLSSTSTDPIFLKISNVGTPVTSLFKPKKGPLANETLAPWPNPSSGTLYLKQHFDVAHIVLYTISGKEMGSYHIRFGQPIDISSLPKGLYMYRAVIDGKAYSGKVMKG